MVSPLAGRGLFWHCGSDIRVQLACLLRQRESKTSQLLGQRHEVVRVVKKTYRKEFSGRNSKKRSVTYDIRVKTKSFFVLGSVLATTYILLIVRQFSHLVLSAGVLDNLEKRMRYLMQLENVKIGAYAKRTSLIPGLEKFSVSQILFFTPYFSCSVACLAG